MVVTRLTAAAIAAVLVTQLHAQPKPPEPPMNVLLARAAVYLMEYEKLLATVVSEEHYVQLARGLRTVPFSSVGAGSRRELKSDVVSAADTGHAWMSFRDVFSVDGQQVRDRDQRLQQLFLNPDKVPLGQARAIADEGARFNLGSVKRNLNFPTMPLTFLALDNQPRSHFTRAGTSRIEKVETIAVSFDEFERPTVVQSAEGASVPAVGKFWIDPLTGRVLKAEVQFTTTGFRCSMTVQFAFVEKVNGWLMKSMDDYCSAGQETVEGRATYSNFRRFGVSTDVVIK